jgi:drug/metabolite transporter superfamily protein YnfA
MLWLRDVLGRERGVIHQRGPAAVPKENAMSTLTAGATVTRPVLSTKQKVGLVLCFLNSLASLPSFLMAADPGEEGPPLSIMILASILGVIGLVATVLAWRGSRVALRVAAGTLIVNMVTSLPAFFVDVSAGVKVFAAVGVVATVVTVVLMFSAPRRTTSLAD